MEPPIYPWLITLTALQLVAMFFWICSIDAIVRRLHAADHALWIELGSPAGAFWNPPAIDGGASLLATQHLIGEIFLVRPDWVKKDPHLVASWNRMFSLSLVMWLNPVVAVIVVLQGH
jgi:hypothetical protein